MLDSWTLEVYSILIQYLRDSTVSVIVIVSDKFSFELYMWLRKIVIRIKIANFFHPMQLEVHMQSFFSITKTETPQRTIGRL
jgi:uncharacterized membrane protein (DUF373 family)